VQRRFPPNEGRWALPGGLIELGERVEEAVHREVLEETGLTIEVENLLDVLDDIHKDERGKIKFHYVLVDFLAKPTSHEVFLNEESSAYRWFRPEQVRDLNASKNTKALTTRYSLNYRSKRHR
jgi:ADP-ribose pyrophosphatase YjhB (NUDIX family)